MRVVKASKLDDIRKARDEWDAKYNEHKKRFNDQTNAYNLAEKAVEQRLNDLLSSNLAKFDALDFDIDTRSFGSKHLRALIKCGDSRKFDDDVALSWSYEVEYKWGDEQLTKETGSWSGLKATTDKQITWLEQSIEAIKYLNSLDWESLLNPEDIPNYEDYVTEDTPDIRSRPNFEAQEFNVQIDNLVGKDILVKGIAGPNGYIQEGVDGWYKIYRETPKFYKVAFVPDSWLNDPDSIVHDNTERIKGYLNSVYNLRKDRTAEFISSPIETMEVPEDLK